VDQVGGNWDRTSVCGARRGGVGAAVAAAIVALAFFALAVPAGARSRPVGLRMFLPAPGHITLESISATVKHPSARQRRLGLLSPSFPGVRSLPPSVRILYLRRTFRTQGSVKTVVLFLVINRAPPEGPTRAAPDCSGGGSPLAGPVRHRNYGLIDLGANTPIAPYLSCDEREKSVTAHVAGNADLAKGFQVKSAQWPLNDLFSGRSYPPQAPTPSQINKDLSDPNLDTGHYDDGHAFGWKVQTKDVWVTLSTLFFDKKPAESVDGIENFVHTDLNADGKTGTGSGTGTGGSCSGTGTTGSQTFTEPSPQIGTKDYDFTTVIPATCDITAGAHAAVYLINDADGSVIACHQDVNNSGSGGAPPPPG
jgi:hypothetical protein